MVPSAALGNTGMPFSVTDILQPLDVDASTSYKRSLEMAHALASSSSSVYNPQRPSTSVTPASLCNPAFGPSSVHNSYYGPTATSTSAFSPNNQYYDYSSTLPNGANGNAVTGQYSPSSCWYGSAASKTHRLRVAAFRTAFFRSVSVPGRFVVRGGQCGASGQRLRTSSRSDDEIRLCTVPIRFAEAETSHFVQPRADLRARTALQATEVSQRS